VEVSHHGRKIVVSEGPPAFLGVKATVASPPKLVVNILAVTSIKATPTTTGVTASTLLATGLFVKNF
jgi:hypothetical protein